MFFSVKSGDSFQMLKFDQISEKYLVDFYLQGPPEEYATKNAKFSYLRRIIYDKG